MPLWRAQVVGAFGRITRAGPRERAFAEKKGSHSGRLSHRSTKSRRSLPQNISSPTKKVGAPKTPRALRLNLKWLPKITFEGLIWWLLGLIFYSIVLAGVVAIFPQGRAWELGVWHRVLHEVNHLWPGLGRLLGL